MQWVLDNWVTMLLIGGFIGFHFFIHGHGGHGGRHKDNNNRGNHQHSKDAHQPQTSGFVEGDVMAYEVFEGTSTNAEREARRKNL